MFERLSLIRVEAVEVIRHLNGISGDTTTGFNRLLNFPPKFLKYLPPLISGGSPETYFDPSSKS